MPSVYAKFDTSEGTFTARLFDDLVPKTVENFVGLAEGTKTGPRDRPVKDIVINKVTIERR